MYVYILKHFFFLHLVILSRSSFYFRKMYPCCRSERGIANKHAAQYRPISSPQVALGIIKSLVAPNHGLLISAPFTRRRVLPRASVAGGVSRPRSGVLWSLGDIRDTSPGFPLFDLQLDGKTDTAACSDIIAHSSRWVSGHRR